MVVPDWLRKMFGSAGATPADVRGLPGVSEAGLASALRGLPRGERGWIALSEAAHLFSTEPPEYAFGEMDDEGKRRLAHFASECGSDLQFMPTEGRVYFRRLP